MKTTTTTKNELKNSAVVILNKRNGLGGFLQALLRLKRNEREKQQEATHIEDIQSKVDYRE